MSPEQLYKDLKCAQCHDAPALAPSLAGRAGTRRELENGLLVGYDEAYIRESLLAPDAKRVRGYPLRMPTYDGQIDGAALAELTQDYVIAAKVAGAGPIRLMLTSVLPNCLPPLIVQAALGVSDAILEAAGLGFLGLGAQPPTPEWGAMLADSREFIQAAPWIMAFPGLAILITVLAINLMGDGLRDALDPKLKRS